MKIRRIFHFVLVAVFVGVSACASAELEAPDQLLEYSPGQRTDLRVEVPAGESDGPQTFIPLSIISGSSPGPTVLMVAGVHGYEFSPILAAQRLADEVDPAELSGTLIIVRVAHISAYENRSPYVNPYDRKNLNRSFPGDPNGTQTERIAWALSSRIIPEADFVLDVHSGDGAEWLEAFVGVYGGPLSTSYETAFEFAEAMGFPNIVRYQMNTQEQVDTGRSLNRQAVAQGLPTVLVEIGENGSRKAEHVEAIVSGIKRGLVSLDMLVGASEPSPEPFHYFDGTQSVPVENSGVWTPISSRGRFVETDEILGHIHDYKGDLVETVRSPSSGFTLYGLAGPPIRAGDSAATIARQSTRSELAAEASDN